MSNLPRFSLLSLNSFMKASMRMVQPSPELILSMHDPGQNHSLVILELQQAKGTERCHLAHASIPKENLLGQNRTNVFYKEFFSMYWSFFKV